MAVPLIVHATRLFGSIVVASSIISSASGKHSSKLQHIPYRSRLGREGGREEGEEERVQGILKCITSLRWYKLLIKSNCSLQTLSAVLNVSFKQEECTILIPVDSNMLLS